MKAFGPFRLPVLLDKSKEMASLRRFEILKTGVKSSGQVGLIRLRCPIGCPTAEPKRHHGLVARDGARLNAQEIENVLNTEIPTVNEDGVGSSPTAPAKLIFLIATD
jgi:hypothetical protein